jgi:hypothetical protein
MNKQIRWIFVLVIILVLTGLACGPFFGGDDEGGEDDPSSESTPLSEAPTSTAVADDESGGSEPEPTPVPAASSDEETPEPSAEDVKETLDLSDSSVLRVPFGTAGYHVRLDLTFEETGSDGTVTEGEMRIDGDHVFEPFGESLTFVVIENQETLTEEQFTVVRIEESGYFILPDGTCISTEVTGFEDSFVELLEAETFLTNEVELIESGVMVNGVLADRYAIESENIVGSPEAGGGEMTELEEGSIAVARDGGYLVQLIIDGRSTGSILGDGEESETDIRYELNFEPTDEVTEIPLPPACEATAGAGTDYPILDDAFERSSFEGILTYQTNYILDDVMAFYREEMGNDGWTLESDELFPPLVSYIFSRDGEQVEVVIVLDTETDIVNVTIMEIE